jgi:formate dehydrogenase major subunit
MSQLTIDGQEIEVPDGMSILNAARKVGIEIPTLCEHPELKPYGGCRLCVVEVEGMRILQTSCTLTAMNGMVVHTNTTKVHEARKFILGLLFSERNHFCMFCQVSNDECDLQSSALKEAMTHWPLQPNWTSYRVDGSHPYFVLDNNRCILCKRCVRACGELVGNFTLGNEERGAKTMVIADYNVPLGESTCIRCGTCLQVCPTGALIERHSAYHGRITDAKHIKSVCVGCSVGCGIEMIIRDNQLISIRGDWNAPINNGILCELGRFKPMIERRERILTPMVRKNGHLEITSWEEAFTTISNKIKSITKENEASIAALVSTRLSIEAIWSFLYLFKNQLHSDMVTSIEESFPTHELGKGNGTTPMHGNLKDIQESDCIVAIGTDLFKNHQVAGFFVKRNLPLGTQLIVIDPSENEMQERAHQVLKLKKGTDRTLLLGLITGVLSLNQAKCKPLENHDIAQNSIENTSKITGISKKTIQDVSQIIVNSQNPIFVYGKGLTSSEHDQTALEALGNLATLVSGKVLNPKGKANSLAAYAYGLTIPFNSQGKDMAFIALGDDWVSERLNENVSNIPFLAVQASYTSQLSDKADVIFPVTTWAEQAGSYLNLEGRLQIAKNGLETPQGVLTNVEVLKALARKLGVELETNWKSALKEFIKE